MFVVCFGNKRYVYEGYMLLQINALNIKKEN